MAATTLNVYNIMTLVYVSQRDNVLLIIVAANGKSPGNMRDLDVADDLYVGGYRDTLSVPHKFEYVLLLYKQIQIS